MVVKSGVRWLGWEIKENQRRTDWRGCDGAWCASPSVMLLEYRRIGHATGRTLITNGASV